MWREQGLGIRGEGLVTAIPRGCWVSELQISERVNLLMTIDGIGEITALTWVLEIGDIERFGRISQVVSYVKKMNRNSIGLHEKN
jgi:hypothetical protein